VVGLLSSVVALVVAPLAMELALAVEQTDRWCTASLLPPACCYPPRCRARRGRRRVVVGLLSSVAALVVAFEL
jgi:hypothetical protein